MKYRKKPIEVEAFRFGEKYDVMPFWIIEASNMGYIRIDFDEDTAVIDTLEGTMTVNPGDWIVKGIKGELYPVKHDIFIETYEDVE